MSTAGAATRLIALLGEPVAHSLSPLIQNAAFRAARLDAVYVALRTDAASLAGLLRGLAGAGGAGNVTIPHKARAAALLDRRSPEVERTGACNTFWGEDGLVYGDNTDVAAIACAIRALEVPAGARVLLLGAGASARATVCALADHRVGEVLVFNRTLAHARALATCYGDALPKVEPVRSLSELRAQELDLVVNATPLGLGAEDPLPLQAGARLRFHRALDLVYHPAETRWIRALRREGIPAADGAGILLEQGAAAFERWWARPAPRAAMRSALTSRRRHARATVAAGIR